jgi:predicted lipoprotein with Yx(FWY)xxD motif
MSQFQPIINRLKGSRVRISCRSLLVCGPMMVCPEKPVLEYPTTRESGAAPLTGLTSLLSACGASTAANPTLPVKTAHLSGMSQTILTDSRGFVLYFYIPDTSTLSMCTGDCATDWPPLLTHVSEKVSSTNPLPGQLTVQQTANGKQVEYNKHLLYTYAGDSGPYQMTGNGVNAWYVATTDLKEPSASSQFLYLQNELEYWQIKASNNIDKHSLIGGKKTFRVSNHVYSPLPSH